MGDNIDNPSTSLDPCALTRKMILFKLPDHLFATEITGDILESSEIETMELQWNHLDSKHQQLSSHLLHYRAKSQDTG